MIFLKSENIYINLSLVREFYIISKYKLDENYEPLKEHEYYVSANFDNEDGYTRISPYFSKIEDARHFQDCLMDDMKQGLNTVTI